MARRICLLALVCALLFTFCSEAFAAVTYDFSQVNVGDIITYGSWEQDGSTSNGKEPIEWIVLDMTGSRIVLISRYCLFPSSYYNPAGVKYKYTTYENSDIRSYLNKEFYKTAFSSRERQQISLVLNSNKNNKKYGTNGGNDTKDRVFLLSDEEAIFYFSSSAERRTKPTAVCKSALKKRRYTFSNKYCYWWLRTPGKVRCNAEYVTDVGNIYRYGSDVGHSNVAVRPAIVLFRSKAKIQGGAWKNPRF